MSQRTNQQEPDASRDPLTGAPNAHPLGVGVGSAGGAVIGAVVGSIAGPVGTAVGAAIGGVAGGLTGKGLAEGATRASEISYWREHYTTRPYVKAGAPYDAYQPAYQFGWESRGRYGELNWSTAEPRLREEWNRSAGASRLGWDEASPAVRDAWDRMRDDADYRNESI